MNTFTPNSGPYLLSAATNSDPNPNKGLDSIQTSGGKALLAYGGPSGAISGAAGSAASDRISVYVVRKGDTLSDVAKMFDVSINTIVWANNLKNARDVHPGDTLVILPISGVERTIVKGDTLKSLAKKYSADANDIAQYNGLSLTDPLVIGSTVIIPGGEIAAPPQSVLPSSPLLGGGGSFLAGYYINPVPGGIITQRLHGWNGIDIGVARGTPIYAAAEGTVIISRSGGAWNGGYGNYVVITHSNGTQTLYSHNSSNAVSVGQQVLRGQIIGYVGSTGRVTGTHLHFEVRGAANPLAQCSLGSVCTPQ
ncbi:M23 family metallopeptidase [Candidatus Kaiserbacteria bacterium]|nr:M23 family metallopeptidase [Candidatus Kaiserbacteria bacterium]